MLLELGLTTSTALLWTRAHPKFGDILWSAPHPKNHHPRFLAWVRCNTLNDYQERKAAHIAAGKGEMEAAHQAADEAINEFKHATRQRRRIERDVLLGVGGHEETLRRYRKGARLTDAYSRRIAKKLWSVSRWVAMERALTECGYSQKEIAETMSELMGAFKKSETAGQKKWKQIRDAVLRWRAAVDAAIKAGEVEASVLKTYAEQFGTQHVRKWVSKNY